MLNTKPEKLDKRVIRTRKLLSDAFLELMRTKEFQQITVQDITDRADINRATFYAHFTDKYALFDHAIQNLYEEHLQVSIPNADRLNYANLHALSLSTLRFFQHFMGHCAPSKRNDDLPFEKQIQMYIHALLLLWLDDLDPLQIPSNISTDLIATTTSSAILAAVLHYAWGNSQLNDATYIDQLMTLLMNGVCSVVCD